MDVVAEAERAPSIAEVALRAGLSRPTAHRMIQTLVAEHYLTQDPQSGRLGVGLSVLKLSASLLDRNRLRLEALPHLHTLAQTTGERTNLGIIHQDHVLYLAGVEKPSLPTIYSRFGKTAPAHCSSLGKAILAHLPEQEVQRILAAAPLTAVTPNSITSMRRFAEELEKIRQQGFAVDDHEHELSSCCIAAAIFDGRGRPVGAIGVSARELDLLLGQLTVLRHTAEVISHVLQS